MEGQDIKVFKTPLIDSVFWGLLTAVFQIFIISEVFEYEVPESLGLFFLFIFSETVVLILLLYLLCTATGKVTITQKVVVVSNIFRKKTVPLYRIQRARKWSAGKAGFVLLIETDQEKIKVGANLSKSQIDKASAYILEQIRVNYPKHHSTLKDEKTHELEEFWRE